MGISYKYFPERFLMFIRLKGHVNQRDIFRYLSKFEKDAQWDRGCRELIDFSGLTDLDLSFEEMRAVRLRQETYYTSVREPVLCVIHAPEDTAFGMARMYQQLVSMTGDQVVQIANTEAEALSLLGQSETGFRELLTPAEAII